MTRQKRAPRGRAMTTIIASTNAIGGRDNADDYEKRKKSEFCAIRISLGDEPPKFSNEQLEACQLAVWPKNRRLEFLRPLARLSRFARLVFTRRRTPSKLAVERRQNSTQRVKRTKNGGSSACGRRRPLLRRSRAKTIDERRRRCSRHAEMSGDDCDRRRSAAVGGARQRSAALGSARQRSATNLHETTGGIDRVNANVGRPAALLGVRNVRLDKRVFQFVVIKTNLDGASSNRSAAPSSPNVCRRRCTCR